MLGTVRLVLLTDRMGPNGIRVHSEERNRDERTISPEAEHGVPELEGSMVFIGVPLVEVDV